MDGKTIQRIKKLQALAERGVGGEKETAAKMLQRLLEKNGISTLEELEKEEAEYFLFSYKGRHEIKLLKQCIYKVLGYSDNTEYYRTRGTRQKMSNVYIRSQNREKLYIFGISFNSLQYEEQHDYKRGKEAATHHTICIADGCLEEIAEYESKERCIEVLDEIEKVCSSYLYAAGSMGLIRGSTPTPPMATDIPRVYQMPEK